MMLRSSVILLAAKVGFLSADLFPLEIPWLAFQSQEARRYRVQHGHHSTCDPVLKMPVELLSENPTYQVAFYQGQALLLTVHISLDIFLNL